MQLQTNEIKSTRQRTTQLSNQTEQLNSSAVGKTGLFNFLDYSCCQLVKIFKEKQLNLTTAVPNSSTLTLVIIISIHDRTRSIDVSIWPLLC